MRFVDVDVCGEGLCRLLCVEFELLRFVERFMINFPCTTRLSVDFLRSRVSISKSRQKKSVCIHERSRPRTHIALRGSTVTTHLQVNNIPNSNIYNPEKTLVLLLKLLLIEYLDCKYAVFIHFPACSPSVLVKRRDTRSQDFEE
jgi:hypothetical protein